MNILDCILKIYPDWKGVVWENKYEGIKPHELETRPIPKLEELEAAWSDVSEEQGKAEHNAPILAKLAEIDLKTIRALRSGEEEWIKKYRDEADAERAKLKT